MAKVQLTTEEQLHVDSLVRNLSPEERQVVELVVDGDMNKSMAKKLGVAVRTIETRRARAMDKLKVRTLPGLVKVWLAHTGYFELNGVESVVVVE